MFKPTLATLVIVVFAFLLSGCAGAGEKAWKYMTFISDAQIAYCSKQGKYCGRGYNHDRWAAKDLHNALLASSQRIERELRYANASATENALQSQATERQLLQEVRLLEYNLRQQLEQLEQIERNTR